MGRVRFSLATAAAAVGADDDDDAVDVDHRSGASSSRRVYHLGGLCVVLKYLTLAAFFVCDRKCLLFPSFPAFVLFRLSAQMSSDGQNGSSAEKKQGWVEG